LSIHLTATPDPALAEINQKIESWDRWLTDRHQAVLVTLRRDGRPQTSNVVFSWKDGQARISLTADRAKTRNARRDRRVLLHVLGPDFGSYLALDGPAELTPLAAHPKDAVVDELAEIYQHVAGAPHPDWNEFRTAMVREGRLILRLRPRSATPRQA
jgi:PPOX class probable F420-dependent enzyme